MVLTDDINKKFFKYMNFLMGEVYKVFYQNMLPKVFPIMKEFLQFSPDKRIGDWFLFWKNILSLGYMDSPMRHISYLDFSPTECLLRNWSDRSSLLKMNILLISEKLQRSSFPRWLGLLLSKVKMHYL